MNSGQFHWVSCLRCETTVATIPRQVLTVSGRPLELISHRNYRRFPLDLSI